MPEVGQTLQLKAHVKAASRAAVPGLGSRALIGSLTAKKTAKSADARGQRWMVTEFGN
jgi:hypothetical protein